jgi:hypothetical protein
VTLELFGMARALVGSATIALEVPDPSPLRILLAALAGVQPRLLGEVLDCETFAPLEPHLVLLDGRRPVSLDDLVHEADKPCLLLLPSGG